MSRAYDHSPVSQITLAGHLSLEHRLSLGPQACPPLPVYAIMLKITLLLKQVPCLTFTLSEQTTVFSITYHKHKQNPFLCMVIYESCR